jgi:hypothetical protein
MVELLASAAPRGQNAPTGCAISGLDRLAAIAGCEVLFFLLEKFE